jgi:hypothetical protein
MLRVPFSYDAGKTFIDKTQSIRTHIQVEWRRFYRVDEDWSQQHIWHTDVSQDPLGNPKRKV